MCTACAYIRVVSHVAPHVHIPQVWSTCPPIVVNTARCLQQCPPISVILTACVSYRPPAHTIPPGSTGPLPVSGGYPCQISTTVKIFVLNTYYNYRWFT